MDFREFQKQYNDYLMHAGMSIGERARGKKKDTDELSPGGYHTNTTSRRIIARYVKNQNLRDMLLNSTGGLIVGRLEEAYQIAVGGLNDETKTRLIEGILQESKSVYKRSNSR